MAPLGLQTEAIGEALPLGNQDGYLSLFSGVFIGLLLCVFVLAVVFPTLLQLLFWVLWCRGRSPGTAHAEQVHAYYH